MSDRNPVIVALDLRTAEEAVRMAKSLAAHVGGFKVGLGLLMGPGPGTVAALCEFGKPVFADAKLHDIPSQVEAAARRLGRHGARWVTCHVSGGEAMVRAAVAGLAAGAPDVAGVLGVTVLTSLDEAALTRIGITATPGRLVSKLARVAAAAGCEGVVCSPRELGVVAEVAPELAKVTPGIRMEPAADDQARTASPAEALARGADWLVVGRPITAAADPVEAANRLSQQLREAIG